MTSGKSNIYSYLTCFLQRYNIYSAGHVLVLWDCLLNRRIYLSGHSLPIRDVCSSNNNLTISVATSQTKVEMFLWDMNGPYECICRCKLNSTRERYEVVTDVSAAIIDCTDESGGGEGKTSISNMAVVVVSYKTVAEVYLWEVEGRRRMKVISMREIDFPNIGT